MSLSFTKKQVGRMADVLDQDYDTVEEAAQAALDCALELIAERGKFTVVGQLRLAGPGEHVEPSDPRAEKIALGYYATEKQATEDALKLAYSTQTGEEYRAWVLPVWHGTPASYYTDRKNTRKAKEMADRGYFEEELARRLEWVAEHPGEPTPEEWGVVPMIDPEALAERQWNEMDYE